MQQSASQLIIIDEANIKYQHQARYKVNPSLAAQEGVKSKNATPVRPSENKQSMLESNVRLSLFIPIETRSRQWRQCELLQRAFK